MTSAIAKLVIVFLMGFTSQAKADEASPGSAIAESEYSTEPTIEDAYSLTGAITVPQPLVIGIQKKLDPYNQYSIFFEGGWFKYSFGENKSRSVKDYTLMLGTRYRPFFNWLTLTGEMGYRNINATVDISNLKMEGVSLANTARLDVNTWFMGLLVGGEWMISSRMAVGFDVGVQFALPIFHGGQVKIIQNPGQVDGSDLSVDDEEVMKRISGIPLPQIALFRAVYWL